MSRLHSTTMKPGGNRADETSFESFVHIYHSLIRVIATSMKNANDSFLNLDQNLTRVNCDAAFWANYTASTNSSATNSANQKDYNFSGATFIADAMDFLFYWPSTRFYVNFGASILLGLCVAVSFTKKTENTALRCFCWNCALVNCIFTLFLCVRYVAIEVSGNSCYYDELGESIVMDQTPDILGDVFLVEDLNKWSAYAVAMSLIFVRIDTYRACTVPVAYTYEATKPVVWLVAIVVADIFPAGIIVLASDDYGPEISQLWRTILLATMSASIWLLDCILSAMTVVFIFRFRKLSRNYTKVQKVNTNRMRSFLLFSILPCIELVPFIYVALKNLITEVHASWLVNCAKDMPGSAVEEDWRKKLADLEKYCGYDSYAGLQVAFEDGLVEVLVSLCLIVSVFKPYFEAVMILFLLPNYRAVLFAKIDAIIRRIWGEKPKHTSKQTQLFVSRNPSTSL